ncbi:MAG TPA: DUF4926 domain-containing protein [Pseudolabrys sp.]|nr:DUF4926 domain-containing protein [Pseudolabrys sp.]
MGATIKEFDTAALTRDLSEHGLAESDLGAVVHLYHDGKAFKVELTTLMGATRGVVTLETGDIRAIHDGEIAQAREVA